MNEESIEEKDRKQMEKEPLRWYIGVLADGTYRFIQPGTLWKAEQYIGEHGGGVYSHAGYLLMASNKQWWNFLSRNDEKRKLMRKNGIDPPHINVPEITCTFSQDAIKWIKEHEAELQAKGGSYDKLPKLPDD